MKSSLMSVFPKIFHTRHLHVGMRGLINYHSSCCVNTLLQAFSATWELADLLNRWESAGVGDNIRNVPLQLKRFLTAMQSHQSSAHRDFLHCLHKNNIQHCVQHDADEVFLSILNFTQQQLDDRALALEIRNLYKISMEMQLQCLECSSIQTQTSHLLSLPLYIKGDHNSLESCVKSFFEFQELKGRDCCFCAQCGTKTPSKQGFKLLSLPRILCVHLKRVWNYGGIPQKTSFSVTFPESFDFSQDFQETFSKDFTQNDCKYVLYAVVVHSGTTSFGHYTAFIHHKEAKTWYFADDSHVEQASWEDVQRTYGGGRYRETAYMLMYRRSDSNEDGQQPECSG
ncbi:hypothetical protein LDENG_00004960 [Lucifuga dentata]|nr:hypothetical protein LDENG_00004960 [Lucifuga dentata]